MPPRIPIPSSTHRCLRCTLHHRPTSSITSPSSSHNHHTPRPLTTTVTRCANSRPADDFYALLLDSPLPTPARTTRLPIPIPTSPPPPPPPPAPAPSTPSEPSDIESRARLVFGSRHVGPEERARRARERDAASTVEAGIRIPPRPSEPDNCCMSGCVNCVWDLYREELEEWAARKRQAEMKLRVATGEQRLTAQQTVTGGAMKEGAISMDDDGGGSEANWDAEEALLPGQESELFKSVPVGIREFMRTEKRLGRRRREREERGVSAT